jgi:hypothetical protein
MFGARTARAALVGFALWFTAFAVGVVAFPSVATAAEPNRAVVIVDTGAEVHEVVISFTEDSITGIEALERAGADPETFEMDPEVAVCALYDIGRPAGPACFDGLGDDVAGYWAYFRAPSGESAFADSTVDPGSALVHDGDVEGWSWGDGTAPVYVSLADLTAAPPAGGEAPPTDTPPTTRPPTTRPPTTAPVHVPVVARPTPSTTAPRAKPAVARVVAKRKPALPVTGGAAKPTTRTTVPARSNAASARRYSPEGDADVPAVATPPATDLFAGAALASSNRDSSTTWSYVGLGLVAIALIGASVLFRTRRRPS